MQRVGHIMTNLQRRTSHIAITFHMFSTLMMWFIKSSSCSSYFEVLLPCPPPGDHSQPHLHPCNCCLAGAPCLPDFRDQLMLRAST